MSLIPIAGLTHCLSTVICSHQELSAIHSSLLITLPNGSKCVQFGDTVNTRFAKIRYYPVAKRRLNTIRIDVRTDVGTPAKFEGGKVFVEIHFRKAIST